MTPERHECIGRLFLEASERQGPDRDRFLSEACGEDGDLRGAVEALLQRDAEHADFLESSSVIASAAGSLICASSGAISSLADEPLPENIGGNRILRILGEGGMGVVYLAEQDVPRRQVAIKVVKPGMQSKAVILRFQSERQALGLMDHPSVARVFDAGTTDQGLPYFVMEYVAGEPITTYCDRQRLTIDERLKLFIQVCQAVQHAHQKAIIHRDLKPTNILVTQVDGRAVPKVIDFGLARAVGAALTEAGALTELGHWLGTPSYMSPEQIEQSPDIDTRSDVYAMGVVLYELLTGAFPFAPRESSSIAELQRMIRQVEPAKPSARVADSRGESAVVTADRGEADVDRLSRRLRGELDWILLKCLEKDRTRRYETASSLGMDITRYLRDEPVLAGPPSAPYRLRKFARRNRGSVIAASLAASALIAATMISLAFARGEARGRRLAQQRADETKQVSAFQAEMLTRLDPQQMEVRLRFAILKEFDAPSELKAMHELRGQVNQALARTNLTSVVSQIVDESILQTSLAAARERFVDQPMISADLLEAIAVVYDRKLSKFDMAIALREECLGVRRRLQGDDHADTLKSMNELVDVLGRAREFKRADPYIRELLERSRRVLGYEHAITLSAINHWGGCLIRDGKFAEAEACFRSLLNTRRRLLGDSNPDTIEQMGPLASALQAQGKYAESAQLMNELVDAKRRAVETSDDKLGSHNNLAYLLHNEGRLEEAEYHFRKALGISREMFGEDHQMTLTLNNNLGKTLHLLGRHREAEPYFREALKRSRQTYGNDNLDTLVRMANLGLLLKDRGEFDEAEAILREAHDRERLINGDDAYATMDRLGDFAGLLHARGQFEEAEALYRRVVEAVEPILGKKHFTTCKNRLGWAQALNGVGRYYEAEQQLRAIELFMREDRAAFRWKRTWLEAFVTLYTEWDRAEPEMGHGEKAAPWRAELESLPAQGAATILQANPSGTVSTDSSQSSG